MTSDLGIEGSSPVTLGNVNFCAEKMICLKCGTNLKTTSEAQLISLIILVESLLLNNLIEIIFKYIRIII